MFHGSHVALITPFQHNGVQHNGAVDWHALDKLIAWHSEQGTHGLVPCGTTGESATLTAEEHNAVIEFCVKQAKGKLNIIAGTGSNSTVEAIEYTQFAEKVGVDAALVITPYYNKPTQSGLFAHFKAIHDATTIPIILYDVPARCAVRLEDETVLQLAALPRIIGIKDATGDLERPLRLTRALGTDFLQLSGEDSTALAYNIQGGHGCISVSANIAPKLCADLQNAWKAGNIKEAQRLNALLLPLHKAMFIETSPAPAKYAASLLGLCAADVRLPLVGISDASKMLVKQALHDIGLL
jgi:4-hydroxy-tetrahydrodipicolinate synthase